jgi:diguanylate cyclase (GGDEF)-like protein/PAS domain S-box-containing protein
MHERPDHNLRNRMECPPVTGVGDMSVIDGGRFPPDVPHARDRGFLALVDATGHVAWTNHRSSEGSSLGHPAGARPRMTYADLLGQATTLTYAAAHEISAGVIGALRGPVMRAEWTHATEDGRVRVEATILELPLAPLAVVTHDISGPAAQNDPERFDFGLGLLLARVPIVIYVQRADPIEGLAYVSPRIEDLLGLRAEDVLHDATAWVRSIHPDDLGRVLAERERANQDPREDTDEYRVLRADGQLLWVRDDSVPLVGEDGTLLFRCGVLFDITERKAQEAQLVHQAFHDQLTGLPSRALFINRLESALARSERRSEVTAVLFLDLDRFKQVNDNLGHAAGDELLIQVGERLRTLVRPGDTVARLGGDEFVVLAEDISQPEIATRIASRIITGIRHPFLLHGQEVFMTTSVGIAFSSASGIQASDLVRDADIALYRAKAEGRARYAVFDTTLDVTARERLELETSLRVAVEADQFILHYQPIVSLETGVMTGTEALLRWEHPTRGLLLPGDFLDVAEEVGLMTPIGQNLLEQACRQASAWHQEFPNRVALTVVVNLSAHQFRQAAIVDQVRRALRVSGLTPQHLRLEITEDTITYDREAALLKIQELKDLGVRISIDGFGIGTTSLAHLVNLPVDALEIDRRFISGRSLSQRSTALIRAIASLADALGAEAGAEGIETREQLARVISAGIRLGQGNLFSHPVPAQEISDMLRSDAGNAWMASAPSVEES